MPSSSSIFSHDTGGGGAAVGADADAEVAGADAELAGAAAGVSACAAKTIERHIPTIEGRRLVVRWCEERADTVLHPSKRHSTRPIKWCYTGREHDSPRQG